MPESELSSTASVRHVTFPLRKFLIIISNKIAYEGNIAYIILITQQQTFKYIYLLTRSVRAVLFACVIELDGKSCVRCLLCKMKPHRFAILTDVDFPTS